MNQIIEKENMLEIAHFDQKIKIENLIYEINGIQVMIDREISATK